jgi:integrase
LPEIRTPRYVPPEEGFWKVYEKAEGQDKVMLLAFLHLAGRRSEIFRMTWEDVDFGNSRVRIWTRKRTDGTFEYDWLPMTAELIKSLMRWWEQGPIKDSPYVFLSSDELECNRENYGKPFKYRQYFMRKLCDDAEVKRFGFHSIRHLTASILYKLGYEVTVIQSILRHKSSGTTERYLKSIGIELVREALEDLSWEKAEVIELKPEKRRCSKSVSKK